MHVRMLQLSQQNQVRHGACTCFCCSRAQFMLPLAQHCPPAVPPSLAMERYTALSSSNAADKG